MLCLTPHGILKIKSCYEKPYQFSHCGKQNPKEGTASSAHESSH